MGDFPNIYDSIWTKELEDRFIEEALHAKSRGLWRVSPDWRNPDFIEHVTPILNEEFNINLPKAFYGEKVELLFHRQNTFEFVIGHTNVYWHRRTNDITYLNEETFAFLATLTPFAHVYKTKGETQYKNLCALFNRDEDEN